VTVETAEAEVYGWVRPSGTRHVAEGLARVVLDEPRREKDVSRHPIGTAVLEAAAAKSFLGWAEETVDIEPA
jgi:hypothetical protein